MSLGAFALSDGEAGTLETLAAMQALADDAAESSVVGVFAKSVADRTGTVREFIEAVYAILDDQFMFEEDGPDEQTTTPATLVVALANGEAAGDCDDLATLIAAVLQSQGIPARFIVARTGPGEWEHVLAAAVTDDGLLPIDPQDADAVGQLPREAAEIAEYVPPGDGQPGHLIPILD
ncbi:MAG: transglutaminase domain-containing protein [Planctomycetota bacterium]